MTSRTEKKREPDLLSTEGHVAESRRVIKGVSIPLNDILGTANQVIVTDSGDKIILSTPQDIDTDADVTFDTLILDQLKIVLDNGKIYFGAGDDSSLFYDGTDFNIKTDEVAPSDLLIDCGVEKTLELVQSVYDDWQGPLTSNQKVNPSAHIVDDSVEASVIFKTNCDLGDYVYMNPQMPHKWKLGTNILPHLHWWQTTAAQPNWLAQYRWQRNGQAKTTAWTYVPLTTNAFTWVSGTLDQITYSAGIVPPVGYSTSDIIQFRVLRDVANGSGEFSGAESSSIDADSLSFDYHYEINTMGSRQEYIK